MSSLQAGQGDHGDGEADYRDNIDGITEQITDRVNGILVSPKDLSALAKAIIKVLNDKELARTMGLEE